MDLSVVVGDKEIDDLKEQINAHKKAQEYAKLKQDLFDITYKAGNELTEFDGGMKEVDTTKSLKTKRNTSSFYELIIARAIKMSSIRPIAGNIVALGLAVIGLVFLFHYLNNPEIKTLKTYLAYFIELAGAIQILKSASRSILLPLLATIIGAAISNQLTGHHQFLSQSGVFYQAMMVTGLIGIAISVFSID
jgi:hypothetical protein